MITVSQALLLLKTIQKRRNELIKLRDTVSTNDYWGDKEKTREPQYSVLDVDKKIAFLETTEFQLESTIKSSNASTTVDYFFSIQEILEPLK